MKLLLTNDDGIEAEGLAALEQAVEGWGETVVVAPRNAFSNCGHQVTTHRPLEVQSLGKGRFAVNGSPADCTRLGLLHLAADADWVLAGINAGGNLGVDVYMSGTVAAAREAALLGRRAIALSQYRDRASSFDWTQARQSVKRVVRWVLEAPLAEGQFWNVNLPDLRGRQEEPRIAFCEPDNHPLAIAYEQADGQFLYRGVYQQRPFGQGTDVERCFAGYVTVSRLSVRIGSST